MKEASKPWLASSPIHAMAMSPDRKQIAAGTAKGVQIWDVATGKVIRHLEIPGEVRAVAYTADGKTLVGGGDIIRFWTVDKGVAIGDLKASQPVRALAFSADGQTLFSGHEGEQIIRRWDVAARRPVAEPEGQSGTMGLLAFSRDAKQLITFTRGDGFRVWDVATGKLARATKEEDPEILLGLMASTGRSTPLLGTDGFATTINLMVGEISRLDQIPAIAAAAPFCVRRRHGRATRGAAQQPSELEEELHPATWNG
jgi:WD40 repeat protein